MIPRPVINKTPPKHTADTQKTNLKSNVTSFKCSKCGKLLSPDDARVGTAYFHSVCGGHTLVPDMYISEKRVHRSKINSQDDEARQLDRFQCPHCMSKQDADAIFCTNCGKRIVELPALKLMVCSTCGEEYKVGSKYCKIDGTELTEEEREAKR